MSQISQKNYELACIFIEYCSTSLSQPKEFLEEMLELTNLIKHHRGNESSHFRASLLSNMVHTDSFKSEIVHTDIFPPILDLLHSETELAEKGISLIWDLCKEGDPKRSIKFVESDFFAKIEHTDLVRNPSDDVLLVVL